MRLRPDKLGRPYHKVPQQIFEAAQKYPTLITDYFSRKYRINLTHEGLTVDVAAGQSVELIYTCAYGKLGFSISRALLTEALEFYFGGNAPPDDEIPPVSASEQRLRKRLAVDIINLFGRAMLSGETFGELSEHDNNYEEVTWEYAARFRYQSQNTGRSSDLVVFLDADLVDALIHRFAPPLHQSSHAKAIKELGELPVRLDCVITRFQMPLTDVLSLVPGDVIMARPMERSEVRINRQECFTGTVCESDDTLYLTSLEMVGPA